MGETSESKWSSIVVAEGGVLVFQQVPKAMLSKFEPEFRTFWLPNHSLHGSAELL